MSTVKKFYDEWLEDDRFFCTVRLLPTQLGDWKWGFMDMSNNNSLGGWVATIELAYQQINRMIANAKEDELPKGEFE